MVVVLLVGVTVADVHASAWHGAGVTHVCPTDTLPPVNGGIKNTMVTVDNDPAREVRSDSLMHVADSLRQLLTLPDSISPIGRKGALQWNDSIAHAQDSINKAKKKSALDHPVKYEAQDSIIFSVDDSHGYLYGQGKINYTNIELTADRIAMSMDSSIVHATGVPDSVGVLQGKPVFKQGGDEYLNESMSYNFKTRKGFISNVYTAQDEGYMRSGQAKRDSEGVVYMQHGTYTTCDEEHPHFYIALSRGKLYPGKSIYSGPAWLVVEDVPLPIALPFAYFPITGKYSSGFIMPSYGDENTRGFYLRDGGYYWAINDYMDLKVTGEIFTKGSWGLGAQTTYKKRYKYSGNFYFNYQVTKTGEKNLPDYEEDKSFKVQWTHRQDSKANPNSSFSASVNFATQSYERNNLTSLYNPTSYSQSTRTSSVSYSRSFPRSGVSLSSSFNISQNMRDSTLSLTLPNISVSVAKFYPFRRKKMAGKERWYERISLYYTGYLSNSITTKENKLLKSDLIKDWKNGINHRVPISASFNVLKYINVTPSFNYQERWYTNRVDQYFDEKTRTVERDTVYGFNRVYNYNLALSANTKIFGFYVPNRKIFGNKIDRVRHVFTPTVSFSYAPDFGAHHYGYWKTYTRTDADGNVSLVEYSPYSGALYGVPGRGKTGSVAFDMSNNIEMKVRSDRDSTGLKKISIIDELGASLSYNMAAKVQPWSNLSTRLRLKLSKSFTFNLNASFATYAYTFDKDGKVVVGNRTEWSYGRFGRFQGMSKNISYTFNNKTLSNWKSKFGKLFGIKTEEEEKDNTDSEDTETSDDMETVGGDDKKNKKKKANADGLDEDGYMIFTLPWSFTVSYGINMTEDRSARINVKNMRYPYKFTQNVNFSGNVRLTDGWNVNFSSGWDFERKEISMTTVNISRDLHCFNISGGLVFGPFRSYHVTLRANASTLTDALKYDKRSSYSSNIQWY